MSKQTPMMKQYLEIKNRYQDAILFFRLGDFYEMFFEDALIASKILNITLTSRDGKEKKIPMCGIPHHSATSYIAKLMKNGYKVAICEQLEEPNKNKGPVKRDVVRIITPGTVLDESMLQGKNNNYLLTLYQKKASFGLAFIDISTGEFNVCQLDGLQNIKNEIIRINPAECLISNNIDELLKNWIEDNLHSCNNIDDSYFQDEKEIILNQFNIFSLEALGLQEYPLATKAAAAILNYVKETLKKNLENITNINLYDPRGFMVLDIATQRNLQIVDNDNKSSLLEVLDFTDTAMGGRLLKKWLVQPLMEERKIKERLDAVKELKFDLSKRKAIKEIIKSCYDIERLIGKVSYHNANAKDLLALKKSLALLPDIKELLQNSNSILLKLIYKNIDPLPDTVSLLHNSINEDPPITIKEGNLIKSGFHEEIDKLRSAKRNGKIWLAELEKKEKEKSGIKSLKIGYNKVFGYYIEITKANIHLVPKDYIRKQTLANSERFITPQLKEYENLILNAEEKLSNLEYEIFLQIRNEVAKKLTSIQKTAKSIAQLDVLLSLAEAAELHNYVEPEIDTGDKIIILQGRHPVIERNMSEQFVPNDITLDNDNQTLIITGPNMAGKSTYLRQTALIVIMAQIGSFVPAKKAQIGIVDRVFTRIGASDNLVEGASTFMVEMNEVANIINNATDKSLVILDEVGRGTSTYDGLSLAWAITEFCHIEIKCKCLFATHYHELIELEELYEGIKNFNIAVKEKGENIIFLRQIVPGGADKSYGIHVAKLAGLPSKIIARAQEILKSLDDTVQDKNSNVEREDNIKEISATDNLINNEIEVIKQINEIELINTSPLQALNILYSLQKKLREG